MIRVLNFLFFSFEEESSYKKDTKYDQQHSTNHVAKNIKTENQKNDTNDSENFLFAS